MTRKNNLYFFGLCQESLFIYYYQNLQNVQNTIHRLLNVLFVHHLHRVLYLYRLLRALLPNVLRVKKQCVLPPQ